MSSHATDLVYAKSSSSSQVLEARRAGHHRHKRWAAAGPQRPAYSGRWHIVSPRAQLVKNCFVVTASASYPFFVAIRGSVMHFLELGVTLPISRMS